MIAKKTAAKTAKKVQPGGMELYFKKIFTLMFGAVGITAIASFITIYMGGIRLFVNNGGFSALYYIVLFGALGLSLWAQSRAFSIKPKTATILLGVYAAMIGFAMTPMIWGALSVNPASILQAFVIAALMFGAMATFGYKTVKDLSFLGAFLFIGMIGLILVGVVSMFWNLGSSFATIVSLAGVLIFALFTAYDMQKLKKAYSQLGGGIAVDQMAVLGALHLYIAFIAMFQYILSLLNSNR